MTCVYSHTASHAESDTELPANNQGEIISIHSTPYTRNILPNRTRHGHSTQQGVLTQAGSVLSVTGAAPCQRAGTAC